MREQGRGRPRSSGPVALEELEPPDQIGVEACPVALERGEHDVEGRGLQPDHHLGILRVHSGGVELLQALDQPGRENRPGGPGHAEGLGRGVGGPRAARGRRFEEGDRHGRQQREGPDVVAAERRPGSQVPERPVEQAGVDGAFQANRPLRVHRQLQRTPGAAERERRRGGAGAGVQRAQELGRVRLEHAEQRRAGQRPVRHAGEHARILVELSELVAERGREGVQHLASAREIDRRAGDVHEGGLWPRPLGIARKADRRSC